MVTRPFTTAREAVPLYIKVWLAAVKPGSGGTATRKVPNAPAK